MPDTPYFVAIEKFAQKLKRTRLRDMDYLLKDHPPLNIEFKCIFDLEPEMFQKRSKIKTFRLFLIHELQFKLGKYLLKLCVTNKGTKFYLKKQPGLRPGF